MPIERIPIESADEMEDLEPRTQREYLMIMYEAQKTVLKRLEDLNHFREDCDDKFQTMGGQIGKLEGAVLGVIVALVLGVAALGIERLLGG